MDTSHLQSAAVMRIAMGMSVRRVTVSMIAVPLVILPVVMCAIEKELVCAAMEYG
mgnify:CR=1 FL=1